MRMILDNKAFVIGRIVHFVVSKERQTPFIITECHKRDGEYLADGVIFGEYGSDEPPARILSYVLYDKTKKVGTWHFPSMKMRDKKQKGPEPGKPLRDLTGTKK